MAPHQAGAGQTRSGRGRLTAAALGRRLPERWRRELMALAFLLPIAALLAVFRIVPIYEAFRLSLFEWDGIGEPQWTGLDNYEAMLHDDVLREALTNNALIVLSLPVWVGLPLLLAVLLHERVPGWRYFRLAFFLPTVLSPVIIGSFFELMLRFDGPVNTILRGLGLGGLAQEWLADPSWALPTMIVIIVWAGFGTGVLIFLAALGTVDRELYDAAKMDGANWRQSHRVVTLPQLRPTIEFYAVVSLIATFASLFPYVYTLTGGGPGNATTTVEFDVYQEAFANSSLGYASAIGVVLFLLVFLLVLVTVLLLRRGAGKELA